MLGSGYFARLSAMMVVAAISGLLIMKPGAPRDAAARLENVRPVGPSVSEKACALGAAPLVGPFAALDDVLSISPLGGVTAPGEPLPAPYIRINTRKGETIFDRRQTNVLAPARADIVAIERRIERDETGRAIAESWSMRLQPCDKVLIAYNRLDTVDPALLTRAGGLASFVELGGPDHIAVETRIRVKDGDVLGTADGFDVSLFDAAAAPAVMARPERYRANPYQQAEVIDAPPSLIAAISPDHARARCAIDYLMPELRDEWAKKLGDSWGMRSVKGENACRAALVDTPGAAQGAWFTDASNNALTNKVSAIALAPDSIDPERLIFALHGRLKSLKPEMVALPPNLAEQRAAAAKDFLTFERGDGRINPTFDSVREGTVYCYQGLRTNFVGPKIIGVLLLELSTAENGAALMKLEARPDASSCIDVAEPWTFSGAETTFYR